jgi:hypothetical protein
VSKAAVEPARRRYANLAKGADHGRSASRDPPLALKRAPVVEKLYHGLICQLLWRISYPAFPVCKHLVLTLSELAAALEGVFAVGSSARSPYIAGVRSARSPTKIWSGRPIPKRPRYTSCVSSVRPRWVDAKEGAGITVGMEHRDYGYTTVLSPEIRDSLTQGLH